MNIKDYIFKLYIKQDEYACIGFVNENHEDNRIYIVKLDNEIGKIKDILISYDKHYINFYYNKEAKAFDMLEFLIETEKLNIPKTIVSIFINRLNLMQNRK